MQHVVKRENSSTLTRKTVFCYSWRTLKSHEVLFFFHYHDNSPFTPYRTYTSSSDSSSARPSVHRLPLVFFFSITHRQAARTMSFTRRTISLRYYFFRIFQSSFFRGRQLPPEAIISSHFSRHPLSERQTRAIKGHAVLARLDPTDFRGEALIVVIE